MRSYVAGALTALAIASCTPARPVHADATQPPSRLASAIEYRRSGGFAGVEDRILVAPDGELEVRDRQGHRRTARLSAGDLSELATLVSGWKELRSPPTPVPADAFAYAITYDGLTVTAVEFGAPPQTFDLVRKRLEGMAERAR
jgi:hypothetical protein